MAKLSYERIIKALTLLGLAQPDAEVYVHLAANGPQNAKTAASGLGMQEQRLHRSLKNLQQKGMISASEKRPARFSAIAFEEVLDKFIKADREEAQRVEELRNQILLMWRSKMIFEDITH